MLRVLLDSNDDDEKLDNSYSDDEMIRKYRN